MMFNTQLAVGIAGLSAITAGLLDFALPTPELTPAITVEEIRIHVDGSTFYDRHTKDGAWIAWSGQIFKDNGDLLCRGGGTSQYFDDDNPLGGKDVGWLVSPDCYDGLQVGMKWVFTWTPLDSDYGAVRYPAEGYGVVLPAL